MSPSASSRTNTSTASCRTRCSRHAWRGSATDATTLSPLIDSRLRGRGIDGLWSHQADAIDRLRTGRNVAVATGTASGKSLCYQVPIVEGIADGARDTALLVFPTKALAQDQLRTFREWLVPDVVAATYDGDTPIDERTWIRAHANVLLTNPEMLHMGILPSHEKWATFLLRLRYVVVDELHTLRGVFGSHVAHVLRRLRRLCEHYGADPTFCFTSATIGNPAELASRLCGLPVEAIDGDGSPQAERSFAVWQRPLVDAHTGTRASANVETAMLLSRFVADGHQTLAFTRSRKGAELVATHARGFLAERRADRAGGGGLPRRVPGRRASRAGRTAHQRRARGRGRYQRARARDRCRLARRSGAQRLPRHAVVDAPTGGARRTHHPARRRGAGRRRRPARPVVRTPPRRAPLPPRRGGGRESRQPVRGARADLVRGARAAPHPRRRALLR